MRCYLPPGHCPCDTLAPLSDDARGNCCACRMQVSNISSNSSHSEHSQSTSTLPYSVATDLTATCSRGTPIREMCSRTSAAYNRRLVMLLYLDTCYVKVWPGSLTTASHITGLRHQRVRTIVVGPADDSPKDSAPDFEASVLRCPPMPTGGLLLAVLTRVQPMPVGAIVLEGPRASACMGAQPHSRPKSDLTHPLTIAAAGDLEA